MKTINMQSVLMKIKRLEKAKAEKVDEILLHSQRNKLMNVGNDLVLQLVAELRDIQDQIDDLQFMDVTVDDNIPIK